MNKSISSDIVIINSHLSDEMVSANIEIRKRAMGYSPLNLGGLTKIHWRKIDLWLGGSMNLLLDDLKKITDIIGGEFNYDFSEKR